MKTYTAREAQQDFSSVMKWLKSTPVAIQENEENIAVILDFKDYVEMVESGQDEWLDIREDNINFDEI